MSSEQNENGRKARSKDQPATTRVDAAATGMVARRARGQAGAAASSKKRAVAERSEVVLPERGWIEEFLEALESEWFERIRTQVLGLVRNASDAAVIAALRPGEKEKGCFVFEWDTEGARALSIWRKGDV